MHVIAGKAVAFGHALTPEFRERQRQVVRNTAVLADGLLGGGVSLVTGGTDNHLVLVDLSRPSSPARMPRCGSTAPGSRSTRTASVRRAPADGDLGLRIGTPALTTRGLQEPEMSEIADIISAALQPVVPESELAALRDRSRAISERFPLYPRLLSGSAIA